MQNVCHLFLKTLSILGRIPINENLVYYLFSESMNLKIKDLMIIAITATKNEIKTRMNLDTSSSL